MVLVLRSFLVVLVGCTLWDFNIGMIACAFIIACGFWVFGGWVYLMLQVYRCLWWCFLIDVWFAVA